MIFFVIFLKIKEKLAFGLKGKYAPQNQKSPHDPCPDIRMVLSLGEVGRG